MFGSECHFEKSSVRQFGSDCFEFKNPFVMSVWLVRFSTIQRTSKSRYKPGKSAKNKVQLVYKNEGKKIGMRENR